MTTLPAVVGGWAACDGGGTGRAAGADRDDRVPAHLRVVLPPLVVVPAPLATLVSRSSPARRSWSSIAALAGRPNPPIGLARARPARHSSGWTGQEARDGRGGGTFKCPEVVSPFENEGCAMQTELPRQRSNRSGDGAVSMLGDGEVREGIVSMPVISRRNHDGLGEKRADASQEVLPGRDERVVAGCGRNRPVVH